MKVLRLLGVGLSTHQQTVSLKLVQIMMACAFLLLLPGCLLVSALKPSGPVLYDPSCDLSPVLKLCLPEQIETLSGVPKTETIVENGINKHTGNKHRSADIKDWFYLRDGEIEYQVIIFYSNVGCVDWYETEKKRHSVRFETTNNALTGRVFYTEEPRSDPGGGSKPMGYYVSRADFRLHNLYIRVETTSHKWNGEKPYNDKLANAVKELAQMLEANLKPPTNEPP